MTKPLLGLDLGAAGLIQEQGKFNAIYSLYTQFHS